MANIFVEQTGTANPCNGIDIGTSSTPTFAGIDGDGDLDAIVGEQSGTLKYDKNWIDETLVVIDAQVDAFDQMLTLLRLNVRAITLHPDREGFAQMISEATASV